MPLIRYAPCRLRDVAAPAAASAEAREAIERWRERGGALQCAPLDAAARAMLLLLMLLLSPMLISRASRRCYAMFATI